MELIEVIHNQVNEKARLEIKTPTRRQKYVFSRAVFFRLLREHTTLSLEEIGKYVGLDHATVLHGTRNIFEQIKNQPLAFQAYIRMYNDIDQHLTTLDLHKVNGIDKAYRRKIDNLNTELIITKDMLKKTLSKLEEYNPQYVELIKKDII